jgi:D-hexose-6-phosphate mutarotase
MNHHELNELFGNKCLRFCDGPGGLPVAQIKNKNAVAEISVYGGHVLSYKPVSHREVLWVSRKSLYEQGKAIRGGIPLCWPWFGGHPMDSGKPSHGFARISMWKVVAAHTGNDEKTVLRLTLPYGDYLQQLWPYPFELTLDITVGTGLELTLSMINRHTEAVTITEAFHTYFAVSDVTRISIHGLDSVKYVDRVDTNAEKIQTGLVTINQEVDRGYINTTHRCYIEDPGMKRKIVIDKEGSSTTVVWNPWIEKTKKMKDCDENDYKSMVCVETVNALNEVVTLKPDHSHALHARISVEEI